MAEPLRISVTENFDLAELAKQISKTCEREGYTANFYDDDCKTSFSLKIEKDMGGFLQWIGLGQSITLNAELEGTKLVVHYTNAEWTSKIIALAIGWFILWIPFVTGLIGTFKQMNLPNAINEEVRKIVTEIKQREKNTKKEQA